MNDFIPGGMMVWRPRTTSRQLTEKDLVDILYHYQGKRVYTRNELASLIQETPSCGQWGAVSEHTALVQQIQVMAHKYAVFANECNVLELALDVAAATRSTKFLQALLKVGRRIDMDQWKQDKGAGFKWIERLDLNDSMLTSRGSVFEYISQFSIYPRSQIALVLIAHGAKVAPDHFRHWLPDSERELEALIQAGADPALTTWEGYAFKHKFIPWFYQPAFGDPGLANPRVLRGFLRNGCDEYYLKENGECLRRLQKDRMAAAIVLAHYIDDDDEAAPFAKDFPAVFASQDIFVAAGVIANTRLIEEATLANARQQLHNERMHHMRYHALRLCFGLQSADVPALVLIAILDHILPASALVPMHYKWRLLTFLKHWRQRNDEQRGATAEKEAPTRVEKD